MKKMFSPVLLFITTLCISYIATIPPGPLSVFSIHTTLQKGIKTALWVCFGGVICETIYAFLAIEGIKIFERFPEIAYWVQRIIIVLIFFIGIFTFIQKSKPIEEEKVNINTRLISFIKGFSLSLFNPALIAFWIIVLLNYKNYKPLTINDLYDKIGFILGAGSGTFLLVLTYILIADKKKKLIFRYLNGDKLNKIVGCIFIGLAIWQTLNLLMI
jgi:threonine/homoserine/homoserine lactone efflux protein